MQGRVDGAFDSGYLMTAMVNGRVFRGVLFSPVSTLPRNKIIFFQFQLDYKPAVKQVPGILYRRPGGIHQMTNNSSPVMNNNSETPPVMVVDQPYMNLERGASWGSCYNRQPISLQGVTGSGFEGRSRERIMAQPTTLKRESSKYKSDLEGVVLTLGGSTGTAGR